MPTGMEMLGPPESTAMEKRAWWETVTASVDRQRLSSRLKHRSDVFPFWDKHVATDRTYRSDCAGSSTLSHI